MTWAEGVDKLLDATMSTEDKEEGLIMMSLSKQIVDSISLARIATALYKLAGLEDNEDPKNFVEDYKI